MDKTPVFACQTRDTLTLSLVDLATQCVLLSKKMEKRIIFLEWGPGVNRFFMYMHFEDNTVRQFECLSTLSKKPLSALEAINLDKANKAPNYEGEGLNNTSPIQISKFLFSIEMLNIYIYLANPIKYIL